MKANRLEGKIAIVTGSSTGIGRAIALRYAEEGAKIACMDIKREPDPKGIGDAYAGVNTDKVINDNGGEAIYIQMDISKEDQVVAAFQQVVDSFGTFDILVNVAAIYRGGIAWSMPINWLEEILDVNVKGTFLCCQAALREFMPKKYGKIVIVASTGGLLGTVSEVPYNVSKGGEVQLTRALAVEYGGVGVRVNSVCPTYVKTALTADLYADLKFRKISEDFIPLHRWCEVEDVANAALFLASEESDYITGVNLPVDGGQTCSSVQVQQYVDLYPGLAELV